MRQIFSWITLAALIIFALFTFAQAVETTRIQVKRGPDATMPAQFAMGEPAFTTDTHRVFFGFSTGREELLQRARFQGYTGAQAQRLADIWAAMAGKQAALGYTPANTTDPRLSDARAPLPHSQDISTVTGLQAALDQKATLRQHATFGNVSAVGLFIPGDGGGPGDIGITLNGYGTSRFGRGIISDENIVGLNINANLATGSLSGKSLSNGEITKPIADIINHVDSADNPHGTTAGQLGLATVATSGSYDDLSNKPTLLRGYDGRDVELQTTATHVQWRYAGETAWTDLVELATISGTDGDTYSVAITGGIRSLLYDKAGGNPSPTMVAFGVEVRKNGAVVTPDSVDWTVPASGSLLSGSSTNATFIPTVAATFSAGAADNRVDVTVTYNGITLRATAPVPATKVGDDGAQGSDTKGQIYEKIGTAVTGDVLNTTSGAGDADGFAFRTVRINGNIHRADLVPGKTVIYSQTSDTADTIKLQINKAGSTNPAVTISAGGALVIY